jgi:hypothetical protein
MSGGSEDSIQMAINGCSVGSIEGNHGYSDQKDLKT